MTILLALGVILSIIASLFFSALTYSLREVSRARLGDWLDVHGKSRLLEPIVTHLNDLIFVTAAGRLVTNVIMLLFMLNVFEGAARHQRQVMDVKITRAGSFTLYGDPAVHDCD